MTTTMRDGADPRESVGAVAPRPRHASVEDGRAVEWRPLAALIGSVLILLGILALRELAALVLPVILGLLIALVAWPMVGALEARGARRGLALATTIAVVLAVIVVAAGVVAVSFGELVVKVPLYETRLSAAFGSLHEQLTRLGIAADPGAITAILSADRVFAVAAPLASAVSEAGGSMLVVAFTLIYALAGGAALGSRATATLGEAHPLMRGMATFAIDVRRYLLVRTGLGLFAAVLSLALLSALGVPLAVLWAILVFFASFVPNVGAVIAVVPPTILAFLDGGLGEAAVVITGYAVINFVQDQFLQPVVMGNELNLSPLVVFVALILWTWVLGPVGALLAVPLTLGLVSVLEAFPSTRGVATLFRDRIEPSTVRHS